MSILRQLAIAGIDNDGAAASFRVHGSLFQSVARVGAGNVQAETIPTGGFGELSITLMYPRGPLAPSGLRSIGVQPNNEVQADFFCQQEGGGGGASALTDFDFFFAATRLGGVLGRVVAMGRITGGRVPAWAWSVGRIDQGAGFVPGPVGNYTFALLPTQGTATTRAIVLAQAALPQAGSDLRSIGAEDVSTVQKRLTLLQEGPGGGPSDFDDYDVDVLVLEEGAGFGCGRPHAGAFYAPGGPLGDQGNTGQFDRTPIVHGVGDVELNFVNGQGIGADESVVMFGVPAFGPIGLLTSIGYTRPSPQSIRITTAVEGVGGGPSVLADYPFFVQLFRVGDVLY